VQAQTIRDEGVPTCFSPPGVAWVNPLRRAGTMPKREVMRVGTTTASSRAHDHTNPMEPADVRQPRADKKA